MERAGDIRLGRVGGCYPFTGEWVLLADNKSFPLLSQSYQKINPLANYQTGNWDGKLGVNDDK